MIENIALPAFDSLGNERFFWCVICIPVVDASFRIGQGLDLLAFSIKLV